MSAPVSVPAIALGVALLVAYWIWLWAFFAKVRPRIMKALGRRLDVKVAESVEFLDAGTYNVETEDAPIRKHGAVWGVDILVTVLGTVGVAAAIFVPAFLVADSGMLLPLEAKLTGRGATIAAPPESRWPAGNTRTTLDVAVTNSGRSDLARCRVRTADYTGARRLPHRHVAVRRPARRRDADLDAAARRATTARRPHDRAHQARMRRGVVRVGERRAGAALKSHDTGRRSALRRRATCATRRCPARRLRASAGTSAAPAPAGSSASSACTPNSAAARG